MKPLALLLACSLSASSAFAQGKIEEQITRVKASFGGKSLAAINSSLASMRPEAVSESDKKKLLEELPLVTAANRGSDRKRLEHLGARLQGALKLHDRAGIVEIIVFNDPRPIVYSKPGVVVVLSTEVLEIVEDDDAALVGVVAHELAHEYVAMPMLYALRARDNLKIRELELFCDAVAVVTLFSLQMDPNSYSKALERICRHSQAVTTLNDGSSSHPSLDARLKLIAEIQALLEAKAVHTSKQGNNLQKSETFIQP
jgi:Zn-dependent protease with chaperone function